MELIQNIWTRFKYKRNVCLQKSNAFVHWLHVCKYAMLDQGITLKISARGKRTAQI